MINDSDEGEEDESRALFPCPFCYVQVQVNLLCSHLHNDHCFDLRNAVCPLCAANLGKDGTAHFISQHTSLLKRRPKSYKEHLWSDASPNLQRHLWSSIPDPAPDPLLSPFLCTATVPNTEQIHPKRPSGSRIQDYEKIRQKSEFVRELISSTIL